MDIGFPLLLIIAMIVMALLLRPWAIRTNVPYPLLLVLSGFVISETAVRSGFDTGIRAHNFQTLNAYLFIPLLVFNTSYHLDVKAVLSNRLAVFSLSIFTPLMTTLIAAGFIYFAINHPTGFPWIAAFITAALLSATSSRSIIGLLTRLGCATHLRTLLETESLLAGIVAITLYSWFMGIAQDPTQTHSVLFWTLNFAWLIVGGIAIGIVCGLLTARLLAISQNSLTPALLTVAAAFFSYLLANDIAHASGAVATFTVGILLANKGTPQLNNATQAFIEKLWALITLLATTGIFLLVGVTVTVDMFLNRWLAMVIAIAGLFIARAIAIYSSLGIVSALQPAGYLPLKEQSLIVWSGMRGAIAIALAFAVPTNLDYWWTIQSMAFGVVLFSLLFQGPITPYIYRRCLNNKGS